MQRNIDQLFKDGVEALNEQPVPVNRSPEANWGRIEGMLGEEKNKRKAAWVWVSAAATVALLIALGWGLSRTNETGLPNDKVLAMNMPDSMQAEDERIMSEILPPPPPVTKEEKLQNENQEQFKSNIQFRGVNTQLDRKVIRGGSYKEVDDYLNASSSITYASSADGAIAVSPNVDFTTANGGTPGYTYTWDFENGQGNRTAVGQTWASPGTYTVVVTDANGCTNGKKVLMEQKQKPALGFFMLPADGRAGGLGDVGESNTEGYAETVENNYFMSTQEPLSTFSIDVDRASYTNHRRFIDGNSLPPKYSVRVEEFINYFPYEYQPPRNGAPFSILPEVTTCPWNPKHKLVRIALKGREVSMDKVPASNIVFLLDVSGSMEDEDKLPLLKKALTMLTEKLREQDKVSIVVYAGAAGLVLAPTSGNNKQRITAALEELSAGGSTAGGEGIELAYATAKKNFIQGGNNRVILATDGDFNVGVSDDKGLEELIVKKREEGVFLSVLGFGEGNLQDAKMELLADKGNGNYNYIDGEGEAKKVLVSEFGGTLYTIAKDVKIQVEFNPAQVESYRLVGYENRKLKNEDFANDKIDAGELGAGHTVTALYEIVPTGLASGTGTGTEGLKYQQRVLTNPSLANEVLTVKLRYKDPDGSVSKLLEKTLQDDGRNIAQTSADFRWAVAVAEYGLILRESEYKGFSSYEQVLALARSAIGTDKEGYRKEFIDLVTKAANITQVAKGN
jgi:Ca-activated chloride channel family protein